MAILKSLRIKTEKSEQLCDVSREINTLIPAGFNGFCLVFSTHTTAGLTINENADPDVIDDILSKLNQMVPSAEPFYRHQEGNSAAHVKTSLMGSSVMVPIASGRLKLGPWQGVFFCEFDGPRQRQVMVQLVAGEESSG